jgi:hypothetical protein
MVKLKSLLLCGSVAVLGMALFVNDNGAPTPKYAIIVTPRLPAPAFQLQDVTPLNIQAYAMSQPHVVTNHLRRWNTQVTDPTASWPDATDPTQRLPMAVQEKFACIRYQESRNHLTSVEIHSGAGGWYQFVPYIWNFARGYIHGLPASAAAATGNQQSRVAVWYYRRNNGFMPEWSLDRKVCNL